MPYSFIVKYLMIFLPVLVLMFLTLFEQKILLGQSTTELSICSSRQIGANLDILSPTFCRNNQKKHLKDHRVQNEEQYINLILTRTKLRVKGAPQITVIIPETCVMVLKTCNKVGCLVPSGRMILVHRLLQTGRCVVFKKKKFMIKV